MNRLFFLLCLASALRADAQIYIADTNAYYFQDFNDLDSFGTSSSTLPAGWHIYEWGSAANASYRAGTGSGTTSDTYSFGPLRSRDRALGSLASGTLTKVVWGSSFINRSGGDIDAVTIAYKGEQWRRGGSGAPDSLRCFISTVRGARLDDTGAGNWTEVPSLLFRSPSTRTGAGALNGNDTCSVLFATLQLMLHNNDTLLIRWCDWNAAGSDDGLAIDSFSIRFRNGPVTRSNHPRLLSFTPDSSSTGLAPDLSLHLYFDRAVRAGGGKLYIRSLGSGSVDTIPATDGQLQAGQREVIYGRLNLNRGDTYIVQFDSSAFDSLGFYSCGHYDSSWQFRIAALTLSGPVQDPGVAVSASSDGRLLLSAGSRPDKPCLIRIYRTAGQLVYCQEIQINAGRMILDPELPPGACYILQLQYGKSTLRSMFCRP